MKNLQAVQGIRMSQQVQRVQEVPCRQAFRSCQELLVFLVDPPLLSLREHQEVQVVPGVHWDLNSIFVKVKKNVKILYLEVLLSQLVLHLLSLLEDQERLWIQQVQ